MIGKKELLIILSGIYLGGSLSGISGITPMNLGWYVVVIPTALLFYISSKL